MPIAAGRCEATWRRARFGSSKKKSERESARAMTQPEKGHSPCALLEQVSVLKNWHREASTRGGLRPIL
ncbi:hypothetical protein SAMN05444166_3766 [Singulisphaera sp. GP187]|nr:hypothetical protein SAMN05444166_3766 [Singulisphaera sp. GP187]